MKKAMALTKEEIEHIAHLSRIELLGDEGEKLAEQLTSIVEYVAQLKKVDTKDITYHYPVASLENIMDEDRVKESSEEERSALLEAMPQRVGDFLKAKGVFKN